MSSQEITFLMKGKGLEILGIKVFLMENIPQYIGTGKS